MIGKMGGSVNNRGQALIEFVLILPVFLLILFSIIDFGIIFNAESDLENDSIDIVNLLKNGVSIEEICNMYPDSSVSISDIGEYYKIKVTTSVNLITPGLNRVLGDPYFINVERIVPYA